ncbi:hypothetical protein KAU33_17100 [Candidatus Dependentiae bacterium]|nr:hypothetical protein [Candidatus Dependentiae bacterium]
MIIFWCFILIVLGFVGVIKDMLIQSVGIYDYIINLAIMFVAVGLLYNSFKKARIGKYEKLERKIQQLQEEEVAVISESE